MTVKDGMQRINVLDRVFDCATKIQNSCANNERVKKQAADLSEAVNMSMTMSSFANQVAAIAWDERKRLEKLIDNTEIDIG